MPIGADFFDDIWKQSWTYIKTVVDVVREPILILDKDFRVLAANEPFYKKFQVEKSSTETHVLYELGNGQWNIPSLRKLMENVLPRHTFFKGFEVAHDFPHIGRKVMILNARQIYFSSKNAAMVFPPIILLAIEDVSDMILVAKTLAYHTNKLTAERDAETRNLETYVRKLEKELAQFKKNRKTSKKKTI